MAAPGAKTYLMNRIDRLFSGLRNAGRRALVGYLTAGDPDFERSVVNIREALGAGLDVLELGVPFSDPTADGPVIQQASQRALAAGMSVARALDMVREIRRTSDAPIVMFGYANPFFRYGFDRLCADAARSGADGLLAVDVPYEESVELSRAASSAGLHLIRLIAPTTPPDRRGMIVGLAVMGFGAGTLVFAPLLSSIIGTDPAQYAQTLPRTFMVMAAILYVFVIGAAQLFVVPPAGWRPAGWNPPQGSAAAGGGDFTSAQMLGTWQFYVLWITYFLGASIGLTTIGEAKPYMLKQVGAEDAVATAAVSILSVFNGVGRLAWGAVSDRVGRTTAAACMGLLMAVGCAVFLRTASSYAMGLTGLCIVGFCFGGYLALMPAFNADFFGSKHVGLNYGLLFSAYGLGGFFVPKYFAGILKAAGENAAAGYSTIFLQMGIAAVIAMVLALVPRKPVRPAPAEAVAS